MNDVQLIGPGSSETKLAELNGSVLEGMEVRTGADSRVELTFANQTISRLGGNSVFDFKKGTRNLTLNDGVILVDVPKSAHGATIRAGAIGAAVTGATAVLEYHPASFKFLVLQGVARLYRPRHFGDSILVRAGQMVIGNPSAVLSDPVDYDVARFVKTCRLIADFAPLRSGALMVKENQKQERRKSRKELIDTNLVIFGEGTLVSLVEPTKEEQGAANTSAPAATPTAAVTPIGVLPRVDTRSDIPR